MRYSQENILSDSRYFDRKTHEIQNSMRQYFGSMSNRTDESNIEIKQP